MAGNMPYPPKERSLISSGGHNLIPLFLPSRMTSLGLLGDSKAAQAQSIDISGKSMADITAVSWRRAWTHRSVILRAAMRSSRRYFALWAYGYSGAGAQEVANEIWPYIDADPLGLPNLCLVDVGTNDGPLGKNRSPGETVRNIKRIWSGLLDRGVIPIGQTVPPKSTLTTDENIWYERTNYLIRDAAERYGIPLDDAYDATVDYTTGLALPDYMADSPHYNPVLTEMRAARLNELVLKIVGSDGGKLYTGYKDEATANYKTRNPSLNNTLEAGTINTAGSVPGGWTAPSVAGLGTVFDSANEPGQKTMIYREDIAASGRIYQGNTWRFLGDGTNQCSVNGPALPSGWAVGDRLAISFNIQYLPAADNSDFKIVLTNSAFSENYAGIESAYSSGHTNIHAFKIGGEADYPAGEFYQEIIIQSGHLPARMSMRLKNNSSSNITISGDDFRMANVVVANLTQLGS